MSGIISSSGGNGAVPKPAVIVGMAKRHFYRTLLKGFVMGTAAAELYWHTMVAPHRRQRDLYYESLGITYKSIW